MRGADGDDGTTDEILPVLLRPRRHAERHQDLVRRRLEVLPDARRDLVARSAGIVDESLRNDGAELVEIELERGDDPEVRPGPTDPPEELGLLVLAHGEHAVVRRDELHGTEVVDREAEVTLEPAHPAAERQPGNARVPDDPDRADQSVGLGGRVELRQQRSAGHPRGASLRIDLHVPHQGEVEDDAVVTRGEPREAVSAAPNRDRQLLLAREAHGPADVLHAGRACDDGGPSVDHPVPDDPSGVVARAARQEISPRRPR